MNSNSQKLFGFHLALDSSESVHQVMHNFHSEVQEYLCHLRRSHRFQLAFLKISWRTNERKETNSLLECHDSTDKFILICKLTTLIWMEERKACFIIKCQRSIHWKFKQLIFKHVWESTLNCIYKWPHSGANCNFFLFCKHIQLCVSIKVKPDNLADFSAPSLPWTTSKWTSESNSFAIFTANARTAVWPNKFPARLDSLCPTPIDPLSILGD